MSGCERQRLNVAAFDFRRGNEPSREFTDTGWCRQDISNALLIVEKAGFKPSKQAMEAFEHELEAFEATPRKRQSAS